MKTQGCLLAFATLAQGLDAMLAKDYPYTAEQKLNANKTFSIGYVSSLASALFPSFTSLTSHQLVYDGYTILDIFGPLQFINDVSHLLFLMIPALTLNS